MLSKPDLIRYLESGRLKVDPAVSPDSITPVAIDLHLDRRFTVYRTPPPYLPAVYVDHSVWGSSDLWEHIEANEFRLKPGAFVLAQTHEHLSMPADLAGLVEGRSSWARVGVSIHVTAPKIDPGFEGHITLEMFNFGKVAVDLRALIDRPAQLMLFRLSTPLATAELYGHAGRGAFQGQTSPTPRTGPAATVQPHRNTLPARAFERYIGVDYSGAETPTSSLSGLQVSTADRVRGPEDQRPPARTKKHWTRRGLAEWLVGELSKPTPTIVGIDHGFSFPLTYFEQFGVAHDWPAFLDDFVRHWPTDGDDVYVDFIREERRRDGNRLGNNRWRRVTEIRSGSAKSLFHFDVQGSVAKSTHSGLPWLKYIRENVRRPVHFWPFDGWTIPAGTSAAAEVYPRIWKHIPDQPGLNPHQCDAYRIAEWLRGADQSGALSTALQGPRDLDDRRAAEIEGWILGVVS